MLRKVALLAAPIMLLLTASPASAEKVYGPAEPEVAAPKYKRYSLRPDETVAQMEARYRREFNRWRYAGWAMAAADIASTQSCLSRKTCVEGNPIYGKNPSLGKMLLIRIPMEVAIDFAAREVFKTDPKTAIRAVQIKTIGTGVVVGLNLRY